MLLGWLRSFGQDYQFQNFDDLNGLPSSETYHVYQDKQGFVWVATDNGVVRFDGDKFVAFNSAHGLTDNTVFGFYEDHHDRIWFRTFSGLLSYFDPTTNKIEPFAHNALLQHTLQSSILNDVKVDSLDQLWFSTNMQGPSGHIDRNGNFTEVAMSLDTSYVFLKTISKQENEYAIGITGTPRFLRGLKIDDRYFPADINQEFKNSPVAKYAKWKGALYVAVNRDIFRYSSGQVEKVFTSDHPIICFSVDRGDNLWVGFFEGGVKRFSDSSFRDGFSLRAVETSSVSSMLNDTEGGFWFTTLDRGVFYFPNLSVKVIHFPTETSSKISAVAYGKNSIYIGRYNGEVSTIKDSYASPAINYIAETPISALFEDDDGGLWGSSVGVFFHIGRDDINVIKGNISGLKGFFVNEEQEVCTFNSSGLYVLDDRGTIRHKFFLIRRPTKILFADSMIYVGSLAGLERYTIKMDPVDSDSLYLKARVSSLHRSEGTILVGTIGDGLLRIDKRGITNLTEKQAPDVENVYAIATVGNVIWLATDVGLLRGETSGNSPVKWKRLNRSSGLVSDKCTDLALLKGDIWVFSDHGISVVPLNISVFSNELPLIYIKNSKVNSENVPAINGRLSTDQNNITIDVGSISFNNRNLSYRHRLDDAQAWIYSSENNISYFSLRPGSYNMQIEASQNAVDWVTYSHPIAFEISRPWWSTWIFRSVVISVLAIVGLMIYRMRVNSIRRRHNYLEVINSHQQRLIDSEIQTQERERKRIAKDLHDGVGTSLSSIKLLIGDSMSLKENERQKRTQEINDNLTEVIADIKRIVYDLHPPALERYGLQVGLKNLTEKINNYGGLSVLYDYYGQRDVSPAVSITIYRIIQELINNTIKHAKATEIRIHVNQFEDEINIMYEDNGVGMVGSRFTGLGLHNIESRIRSLQGRMSWESNHKGTFYNFDIPFS